MFGRAVVQIRSETIVQQRTRADPAGPSMFELMKFSQPRMRDLLRFQQTEDLAAADADDSDEQDDSALAAAAARASQTSSNRRKKGQHDSVL